MKHFAFNTVIENQINTCKNMLVKKSDEYSGAEDRLHNFRVAAALEGVTEKQALAGMMAKHTVSVYDMVRDDKDYAIELWDEKITDHINYLLLLKALVIDGKRNADQPHRPSDPIGVDVGPPTETEHNINELREKLTEDPIADKVANLVVEDPHNSQE